MFDRLDVARAVPSAARAILIIGGAGGVGSIAIQLARTLTDLIEHGSARGKIVLDGFVDAVPL